MTTTEDDNDTTQQHLVNLVLKALWPGHESCRYSACPNGMIEVDHPNDTSTVQVSDVTRLHAAGLQPIVYLSRGCVAVAGPDHVPGAEARRQRQRGKAAATVASGTSRKRKRKRLDDDDDDNNNTDAAQAGPMVACSRMAALLRDVSALDSYACPTVTTDGSRSFCVQGLGSVVHGDLLQAVKRWNDGEPQPAPAVPTMVYDFAMCQVRVKGV